MCVCVRACVCTCACVHVDVFLNALPHCPYFADLDLQRIWSHTIDLAVTPVVRDV